VVGKEEGAMRARVEKRSGGWAVTISDHATGYKKTKIVGSKKTAKDQVDYINAKINLGEFALDNDGGMTLKEYAKQWLAKPHDWQPTTRGNYEFLLKRHVYKKKIGRMPIGVIRRKTLKDWLDGLIRQGYTANTVCAIKIPLSALFSFALDMEDIKVNPIVGIKVVGAKKNPSVEALEEDEAETLLEQAEKYRGGIWYPYFLTMLRCGLRPGEAMGLKTGDIDYQNRFIHVQRNITQNGKVQPPKTKNGYRTVDATPAVIQALKDRELENKKRALKNGTRIPEFLFVNEKGELPRYRAFLRGFKACLKKAKIRDLGLHSLRHTYATIRLNRSHDNWDVSKQLGHSSTEFTKDRYGDWKAGRFKHQTDELDIPAKKSDYLRLGTEG
jgi:integrase